MPSSYTRKSVNHVLRDPQPVEEFYVFVAQYWPSGYEPNIGDEDCVFDQWDRELAPSPRLLEEYDPEEPWAEWARQYVAEIGEDTIHRRARQHAEAAGDRDVVFVCYEPDSARPRCHTFSMISVLEGQRQTALDDFAPEDTVSECDHEWCDGPESETLPCFACFDPEKDYDGRR